MTKSIKLEVAHPDGGRKVYEVVPRGLVAEPSWALQATDLKTGEDHLFPLGHICRIFNEEVQRFLCATVYVRNDQGQFLLLFHKKLQRWLPPGGKVDGHETPDEAAIRECFEETGLNVELLGQKAPVEGGLMTPYGAQLNVVIPNERDHVDLIYLARPVGSNEIKISTREAEDIRWFSIEEIERLNTFSSVIDWCKKFYGAPSYSAD
jgi:8-oxo-dGTP pyrophosphatase MutT (NUDIX family)